MVLIGPSSRVLTALIVTALSACASAQRVPPASALERQSAEVRRRPPWMSSVAADVDLIARCSEGREPPVYVVLVYHTDTTVTSVTTVDGGRAVEHCVVDGGRVLLRQPGGAPLSAYPGVALFSLGPVRPAVDMGTVAEEVVQDGHVLGWVHWPRKRAPRDEGVETLELD